MSPSLRNQRGSKLRHGATSSMNALRLSLMALLVAFAVACDDSGTVKVDKAEEDPSLPPPNVSLPDPPPASGFEVPKRNNDNTLRVEGLIHYQDEFLDQQVEVKGVIVQISKPCDPKKAKKNGEECPEPYLTFKDDQDGQKFMRAVGYKEEYIKKAKLEIGGEPRVFKGTYKKVAQGFVATEDGLILLDFVDDVPVLEEK